MKLIDFTSWVFLFEASCDAVETEGKASRGLGGLGGAGGRGQGGLGGVGGEGQAEGQAGGEGPAGGLEWAAEDQVSRELVRDQ